MSLFLTVRMNQTLYLELPDEPGGEAGERIQLILREKRGRTARFEVLAPKSVYVDVTPSDGVKRQPNGQQTRSHE